MIARAFHGEQSDTYVCLLIISGFTINTVFPSSTLYELHYKIPLVIIVQHHK